MGWCWISHRFIFRRDLVRLSISRETKNQSISTGRFAFRIDLPKENITGIPRRLGRCTARVCSKSSSGSVARCGGLR